MNSEKDGNGTDKDCLVKKRRENVRYVRGLARAASLRFHAFIASVMARVRCSTDTAKGKIGYGLKRVQSGNERRL